MADEKLWSPGTTWLGRGTTLSAGLQPAGPAAAGQHRRHRTGRGAGPVDRLPPADAQRLAAGARHGVGQVAVEVAVALAHRGVVQAPVELDAHALLGVHDVLPGGAPLVVGPDLPAADRQRVGALDAGEVLVLQHRAGALGHVEEHAGDPGSASRPGPGVEGGDQALRRRAPRAAGIGQRRDRGQLVVAGERDVERRLLVAQPWRPGVPPHPRLVAGDPVHDDPAGRVEPSAAADGDVHEVGLATGPPRPLGGAQRTLVRQRGGRRPQHRRPRSPGPVQRPGVVDVHAAVHLVEVAPTEHPGHAHPVDALELEQLAARHDAALVAQQPGDLVHGPTLPRAGLPHRARREPVEEPAGAGRCGRQSSAAPSGT